MSYELRGELNGMLKQRGDRLNAIQQLIEDSNMGIISLCETIEAQLERESIDKPNILAEIRDIKYKVNFLKGFVK